jgi:hypothetical protein
MRPDLLERNNSSQEQHGADVHHPEGKHQEHEGPAAPQAVRPMVNTHPQMAKIAAAVTVAACGEVAAIPPASYASANASIPVVVQTPRYPAVNPSSPNVRGDSMMRR